ncbi:helix-turn-helix transcriptional regulator [Micromonospora halophytica]|uniref:Helix-turn-helix domain-containing protein n=1 Tax=Micromonospora halophytica TaxID=47864 RepID=A0A1C5GPR3_9ACTN|nr:helix-turn-helix transcriptional regulator [Micromonospora halophytica]SCG35759.1 Helix-turn-helix domain-containing protein [Micromonospora halophytica]
MGERSGGKDHEGDGTGERSGADHEGGAAGHDPTADPGDQPVEPGQDALPGRPGRGAAEVPWSVAGIVRAVRRRADASQRELARAAGLHHATVGRIEAGGLIPSLDVLHRVLAVAGLRLVVVDEAGRVLRPMRDRDDTRDGAGRRYPSHLDTILDPEPGEWWADVYGLARPPETYYRNRAVRDAMRRRSQWEVRVAKYRNVPPPPRVPRPDD